jgi:hypothetical protein
LLDILDLLFSWAGLFLWLQDGDDIWVLELWSVHAGLVVWLENLHLNTENTLSEEDVSDGGVDVFPGWVTGVDHHTVDELHSLCSLASDLTTDNDLATSGTLLHNESEDTVGGSSDGKTAEKLVSEGLGLGNGAQASVSNSLDVKVDLALLVAPSLVDDSGEFTDSSGLLAENLAWSGGNDDDLASLGLSDDDTRVSILGELSLEELVELGLEETVSHEKVLFGDWPSSRLSLSHFDLRVDVCFCDFL